MTSRLFCHNFGRSPKIPKVFLAANSGSFPAEALHIYFPFQMKTFAGRIVAPNESEEW